MAFDVETPSATQAKVRIRVPREDLEHAIEHELGHLQERVRLKGFRPGKIPRQVLKRKYAGQLANDVSRRLLQENFQQALEQHRLHPVEPPSLRDEDLKARDDGSLQLEFDLEVLPHLVASGYDRFVVTPPALEWNEAEVERELEALRRQAATAEEIADGQALDGDVIVADLLFQFLDGTALPTFERRMIDTANALIDGVKCDGVAGKFVGCSRGSRVKVTLQLPPEFPLEEHRGKTAVIECVVKDIRRVSLPDANAPEFAQKLGMKSVDEVRQRIRDQLEEGQKRRQERAIEEICVDQLLDRHKFPIPDGFLQRSIEAERERVRKDLLNKGVPVAEAERQLLEVDGRMRTAVERRIRESHLLDCIAAQEKTEVTPQDLERQLVGLARLWNVEPQKLYEHFQSQGWIPQVVGDIRRAKVRARLRAAAAASETDGQKATTPPPTENPA